MGAGLGGRVARVLLRIVCFAACVLGLSFALALLVAGSDTAQAESVPGETTPWAEPGVLSAAATRRAGGDAARSALEPVAPVAAPEPRPSSPTRSAPGILASEGLATVTTPIGSLGAGGGGGPPESGPSITQLAVLSAALVGVRWLSQRVRASELSWRNALITLSIERPG